MSSALEKHSLILGESSTWPLNESVKGKTFLILCLSDFYLMFH